jgi:RimJ/RimL family protein N-acetyltransferase
MAADPPRDPALVAAGHTQSKAAAGMNAISFRRMSLDDLPVFGEWLMRPHIREWWGDPEEEIADVRQMIEGQDTTEPYLFILNEVAVGYIQLWFLKDQQTSDMIAKHPWIGMLPASCVGIDVTIADPDRLSKGIGCDVLSAFVQIIRQRGHDKIIIDPDTANKRAIRAYEKAGFRTIPDLLGKTGDSLLMQHHTTQLPS